MNKEDYFKFARKFAEDIISLSEKKNNDYTGGDLDPFANFTAVEKLGICTTEQGFLTRMTDKLKRLIGFINGNKLQVENESVIDTLQDLANYSILLAGYLKSKELINKGCCSLTNIDFTNIPMDKIRL
jgi:hypothetical protein